MENGKMRTGWVMVCVYFGGGARLGETKDDDEGVGLLLLAKRVDFN